MVDTTGDTGDLAATFRQKAAYMKSWKPASTPSNRDRLELYALHKQAVSGDAPSSLPTQTAAERAKYQAWRSKSGLTQAEAMRLYLQESDRQVRVYGMSSTATPQSTPVIEQDRSTTTTQHQQPRGLAAIPLLCAAASESRQAYLRRLANTLPEQAWWTRQEPLCASPGTLWALPEAALIKFASIVEHISLSCDGVVPLPAPVVQSFLWPLHNCLLALWMGLILVSTAWTAAYQIVATVIWGSRRTGFSLPGIWKDEVQWSCQSVQVLTEGHQPLTARLVGLAVLPYTVLVGLANMVSSNALPSCLLYAAALVMTWWYWFLVLPFMTAWMLGFAIMAGNCFALIELAGV